jgi:hypothetical protein
MTYEQTPQGRNPYLWDIAKRRAAFKRHLTIYLVINAFFWSLWFITGGRTYGSDGIPWPVWPAIGWGIGLTFHYFGAYMNNEQNDIEKEYNKLQNNKPQ